MQDDELLLILEPEGLTLVDLDVEREAIFRGPYGRVGRLPGTQEQYFELQRLSAYPFGMRCDEIPLWLEVLGQERLVEVGR